MKPQQQFLTIKDLAHGNMNGESQKDFYIANSQTPSLMQQQQQMILSNPVLQKPRTSFPGSRNHATSNGDRLPESFTEQNGNQRAVVKMKVHSFDPLGAANILANEQQTYEAGRLSVNALHMGSVQTKNLFLNTIHPGQTQHPSTFSSPQINAQNKGKQFFPVQNSQNVKTFKILQQIPAQNRVQTPSQNQQLFSTRAGQKQIFATKKILATGSVQNMNLPQQTQLITLNKHYSTPLVLSQTPNNDNKGSAFVFPNQNAPKLFTQTSSGPFFHRNNPSTQIMGSARGIQSQASSRGKALEDKNLKYLNQHVNQQKLRAQEQQPFKLVGTRSCEEVDQFQNVELINEQDEEQISPSNVRYSNIDFNSLYSNQMIGGGRNSDPTNMTNFRQNTETFMHQASNGTMHDQISTQFLQHQRTQASNNQILSPNQTEKWPKKNTQGLQGSIYSSSATSSIDHDNNNILDYENSKNQHNGINREYILKRRSFNPAQQANGKNKDFEENFANDPKRNSMGQVQIIRKNFAETCIPVDLQSKASIQYNTEISGNSPTILLTENKTLNTGTAFNGKQHQRKIISKSNIKFVQIGGATASTGNITNPGASQSQVQQQSPNSQIVGLQQENQAKHFDQVQNLIELPQLQDSLIMPAKEVINIQDNQQNQQQNGVSQQINNQKKAIKKIRDAQLIADSFDKKGINNAIVQYQFEMADKEEENCFKGLYEALNGFF
eukprot:403332846